MMIVIVASLVPLTSKNVILAYLIIDRVAAVVFIIDYLLRWFTYDYKIHKGAWSFLIYPFTPMAIIDLLSILPSLNIIGYGFRVLKVFRLFRTLRVFRVFKVIRHSKNIRMLKSVLKAQKRPLLAVGMLAVAYIFVSAIIVFSVEPDSFDDFFEAIYWATVSLTTVGYGDIYPVTTVGRIVTMVSSLFGIAIIALPAGSITAGFMNELNKENEKAKEEKEEEAEEKEEEKIER